VALLCKETCKATYASSPPCSSFSNQLIRCNFLFFSFPLILLLLVSVSLPTPLLSLPPPSISPPSYLRLRPLSLSQTHSLSHTHTHQPTHTLSLAFSMSPSLRPGRTVIEMTKKRNNWKLVAMSLLLAEVITPPPPRAQPQYLHTQMPAKRMIVQP